MDNPVIAKAAKMTALWDQWLLQRKKPTAKRKTQVKKTAKLEKKEKEKSDKVKAKNQLLHNIRCMASINSQVEVGAFCAILSNSPTKVSSNPVEPLDQPQVIIQTPGIIAAQAAAISANQNAVIKKKTVTQEKANCLNKAKKTPLARFSSNARPRIPTPLLIQ